MSPMQSIADFSGIPRETVRRKLKELIASGWVERGADLAPLMEMSVQHLAASKAMLAQKPAEARTGALLGFQAVAALCNGLAARTRR